MYWSKSGNLKSHAVLELKDRSELVKMLVPGKTCVEIGVANGEFAKTIVLNKPKKLWLVDIWRHQNSAFSDGCKYGNDSNNVSDEKQERRYTAVCAMFSNYPVSILRMWSHDAAGKIVDKSLDFIYLDANHSYEATSRDLNIWYPKLICGGWFCGHDFNDFYGVKEAVLQFLQKRSLRLRIITKDGRYPSFGFQKL